MKDQTFAELVAKATGGDKPYPYQEHLAEHGLPEVLRAPTGAGKTLAAVLAWLHRRDVDPDNTPRWLVFVLPQRTLVQQTVDKAKEWLGRLRRSTPVHVLMGGEDPEAQDWKSHPECERIFVGTQDMVLSRLLMRGFAEPRPAWPMSFGLFHAGVQFVFDEVQLMGPGLWTSLQLQGLREKLGTALPCRSMWMSATLDPDRLRTADLRRKLSVVEVTDRDRIGDLQRRLEATREITELDLGNPDRKRYPKALAEHVLAAHQPGTRTLVMLNTVDRARDVFAELRRASPAAKVVLLHSRFRPDDRDQHTKDAVDPEVGEYGTIVVSTQVLEAGVDVTSETLVSEVAPWTSLVQRAGRCNRDGYARRARLLWTAPPAGAHPYDAADVQATAEHLRTLDGRALTSEELAGQQVPEGRAVHAVLRKRDLLGLFDTAPDLSGSDIDVSPFIRDATDRTVSVAWRHLPDADELEKMPTPQRAELCPAPIKAIKDLATKNKVLVYDQRDGKWLLAGPRDIRPTALLVSDAASGGYTAETGFDPASKTAVCPVELAVKSANDEPEQPNATNTDPQSVGHDAWIPLVDHLADAEREVRRLLAEVSPQLPAQQLEAIALAARYHDLGKTHLVFVTSLEKANPDTPPPNTTTIWAKSPSNRTLRHDPPGFRHELVSALLLLKPDTGLLDSVDEPDLVTYLALAHHGKARVTIRAQEGEAEDTVLGVREGSTTHPVDLPSGRRLAGHALSLAPTKIGAGSLTDRALRLRDRADLGPFRLAFCEAIVRSADWCASQNGGA
ncbi:CRISPR-associated helicase Cas3' [Amycolatopsis rhizosphaerae]|uniref:CRISPR-associated helicase Cas3 n=1 Tax=Amycolatopsis rhizosphaerae TaxID=2053003 RepID=A0A558CJH5_9PSEU|nr:CRISPR-associated helicase Cas3' [Amycolatopsis rhizosphaerae]TVT48872.1 CRISPR-associated helicase Cas3' [Amycolatopsis rhizosphaerae]